VDWDQKTSATFHTKNPKGLQNSLIQEFQEFSRVLRIFQEFLENFRNIKENIANNYEFSGIFKNISSVLEIS
jgi:hypothetical protein